VRGDNQQDPHHVQLRPLAEEDLIAIWLYSYEQWGGPQADLYLEKLEQALARIVQTPQLARERREFTPAVRILPCEQHLIVYLVTDNNVDVVRILHQSMDIDTQID